MAPVNNHGRRWSQLPIGLRPEKLQGLRGHQSGQLRLGVLRVR